ncbi:class A beta-lactamase [Variovorax ginsengisoli]|uniref:Beta-lactamase n=1 Tax=Variovorax ginsengisoli TaxID=363844 RepID=A0ABT9S380_9BURK|nr:class A beta-lactamase [Variovorax ginsengisoli]MDP9898811.1 beta-lactamase class A [Variovorax ginsengisoli]
MQRRRFSIALGGSIAALACGARAGDAPDAVLQHIEAASGGRLGVSILDTASGRHVGYRADERFPMCSTFKWLAAALVLQRVDAGQEQLARPVAIEAAAILAHSPLTEPNVGKRMTMGALCKAAIVQSDNAAANLVLASFGGPPALTAFARSLGDDVTRLDRTEPTLNAAEPGDPRDTTSPAAMLGLMRQVLTGHALQPASREQLLDWLLLNETGGDRLRARLPAGWKIGDKTGAGAHGTHNDVGIIWPPSRPPWLVCAYLTQTKVPLAQRNATLATVGGLLVDLAQAA